MTTTRTAPPFLRTGGLLRSALRLDALVTAANAAAYLLAAPLLDGLLGLPAGLLRAAGAFLAGYAVAVWLVAARRPISTPAAEVVVGANVLWVVGSLAAVLTGLGSPSTVGAVWLVLQAAVVAGFAGLQVAGLRGGRQARAHG